MLSFTCNMCGRQNTVSALATEPASCDCGSNVRLRALVHLLSLELFGVSVTLADWPEVRSIQGLGMSDQMCYSRLLAAKVGYTNTYLDREPRMDFTASHPGLWGKYDFITSADVVEHIAPPLGQALHEVWQLLQPSGFFAATIPCDEVESMVEHFPGLHEFRLVRLGGKTVLVNRRRDGQLEATDKLRFHGGSGSTLEMRQIEGAGLCEALLAAGFEDVFLLSGDVPEIGIVFDSDVSQPLIARKGAFGLGRSQVAQIMEQFGTLTRESTRAAVLQRQISMAARSKWLRLGRLLGVGPDFRTEE